MTGKNHSEFDFPEINLKELDEKIERILEERKIMTEFYAYYEKNKMGRRTPEVWKEFIDAHYPHFLRERT
ncbi:hypothetical protein HY995_00930 [Candidatus Micrarchaeota archaeon]|nr:hypothetical protein [Candidatus Micrarchaeota archaeon]